MAKLLQGGGFSWVEKGLPPVNLNLWEGLASILFALGQPCPAGNMVSFWSTDVFLLDLESSLYFGACSETANNPRSISSINEGKTKFALPLELNLI